ncbi:unnamed protein product [Sympodiomycopsis kandeliae]
MSGGIDRFVMINRGATTRREVEAERRTSFSRLINTIIMLNASIRSSSRPFWSSCATASSSAGARTLSTTSRLAAGNQGFFQRPSQVPAHSPHNSLAVKEKAQTKVARPHPPPGVPSEQAPNYPTTWSETQNPRDQAMSGPRFEQMAVEYQPMPLSAMEMIQREPIRLSTQRITGCDGGGGPLGHPRVFINLDKPGPKACPYCGLRYELDHSHAHH